MKILLTVAILMILAVTTYAQVQRQVFVGAGGSFPAVGDPSPTITAGAATLLPLGVWLFVRPAITFGQNFPETGKPTRQIQALGFLGLRLSHRVSILGGGGETFLLPEEKASQHLATLTVTTATTICQTAHGRFGLFTPVNHNAKGWGAGLLLGYTW
jgi:hypothetical protein